MPVEKIALSRTADARRRLWSEPLQMYFCYHFGAPPLKQWEKVMAIDSTEFGNITIDGKTYEHDVIIRLSGKVEKRKKKLSKELYGTSHIISKEEAKFIYEDRCEALIVGTGQEGNVCLSPEAQDYFDKRRCHVLMQPTPEAIRTFNHSQQKKIGLMHVTC